MDLCFIACVSPCLPIPTQLNHASLINKILCKPGVVQTHVHACNCWQQVQHTLRMLLGIAHHAGNTLGVLPLNRSGSEVLHVGAE